MTPPTNSTTRILIGGAGAPNYGDELIVKGWLDQLARASGDDDKIVLYENSSRGSQSFHVPAGHPLAPRAVFRDNLTLIAKAEMSLTFWEQVERGFTFMRDFGFLKHGYNGTRELFQATSFTLHGGGYLHDIRSDKGFLLGLVASFRKLYGIPAYATGIGFGPFKNECPDPARFDEILSCFDFFETRDIEGYELVSRLAPSANVINGIDDCFLIPADRVFRRDSSKRRLHLSLISSHLKFMEPSFWTWLAEQAALFDEVLLWESYPWNDRDVIARVKEAVLDCKVMTTRELVHQGAPIGSDDVFITHRFHVHFAAARAGARGFFIAPCPYYRQKHQSIVELGSGLMPLNTDHLPELGNLPPAPALDESQLHSQKLSLFASSHAASPV